MKKHIIGMIVVGFALVYGAHEKLVSDTPSHADSMSKIFMLMALMTIPILVGIRLKVLEVRIPGWEFNFLLFANIAMGVYEFFFKLIDNESTHHVYWMTELMYILGFHYTLSGIAWLAYHMWCDRKIRERLEYLEQEEIVLDHDDHYDHLKQEIAEFN